MKKEEKNATKNKVNKKHDVKKVDDKKEVKNGKRNNYVAENKKSKKEKVKRENIFKRIFKYFKGVGKEIKRIRWTTGKDLLRYSVSTVIFVLFFGLYFYGIDWIVLLVRSLAN